MCPLEVFGSASFCITVPRESKLLLMNAPSFLRCSCEVALSEPARSIRFSCETLTSPFGGRAEIVPDEDAYGSSVESVEGSAAFGRDSIICERHISTEVFREPA